MKIKQRRLLKHGFSFDEIKMSVDFEIDIEEMNKELIQLENYAMKQECNSENEPKVFVTDEDILKTMKKKINLDREWDSPKLSKNIYNK